MKASKAREIALAVKPKVSKRILKLIRDAANQGEFGVWTQSLLYSESRVLGKDGYRVTGNTRIGWMIIWGDAEPSTTVTHGELIASIDTKFNTLINS